MPPFRSLQNLLDDSPGSQLYNAEGIDISTLKIESVTADSRQAGPGTLFVAVPGLRVDGHRFIPNASAAGASAIAGTYGPGELAARGILLPPGLPYLQNSDGRLALAQLSAALHGHPSRAMTVLGVTGTDGKTTTCTLLESILVGRTDRPAHGGVGVITTIGARIAGAELDTGFHVTTPEAPDVQRYLAQMRDAGCRFAIVESTSHGLDQKRVAAVDYDVAAVTNITHEHLDYHGTFEAYQEAKALLFRALFRSHPKANTPRLAVLNRDDPGSYDFLASVLAVEAATEAAAETATQPALPVTIRSYSLANPTADVRAERIVYRPDATTFDLHWWGGPAFPVETRLIGDFNVSNILCAATAALGLGIAPESIAAGVASLAGVLGRMQRMDGGQEFLALVDFAHSPGSLERALKTLRPLVAEGGRLIAVFGSAGLRDRAKRRLMGQVSGRLADFTVITAEDPRTEDLAEINREIAAGVEQFAPPQRYRIVADRAEAIGFAARMARPGDVVAAFGKGHERSICFGETERPWNEQEVMLDALAALKNE
ncbi:MAG: UDP-N-acetylmuramoyl-L-alanyl-D-glutamate--2,6-diaminopimelate ligase [Chloroflexi bacterium]|nr:MAG: UDP-N-acetylmuramoyl-L-alanyl-D-glutamate--2,6-diaminopimelate ligase [Chloroflexota bacterium]